MALAPAQTKDVALRAIAERLRASRDAILRENADESGNVNDQPGFDDGRLGGSDGEDRQGEPNNRLGSDLGGEAQGGEGTGRSGGVDGGPERKTPLPG